MSKVFRKPNQLILFYAVPALAYLLTIPYFPFPGDFVLKASPILLLALAVWNTCSGALRHLLTAALICSACGDISLSFQGELYFLIGLSCFLLAHILYIIAISRNSQINQSRWPILLVLSSFTLGMIFLLRPHLGPMLIPVFVYIAAIFGMAVSASLWQGERWQLLLSGAIIFMLSDSMIALNRFVIPISWAKYFIMTSYYAGQLLIILAFISPYLLQQKINNSSLNS